jgi:predicted Zn-dependent peptidase
MEKRIIKEVNYPYYYEKLNNGLDVIIVPFKNSKTVTLDYGVKYGSKHLEYELDGKKYISTDGVAHYLEHTIFNYEINGMPIERYFQNNGAVYINAGTFYHQTDYMIKCTRNVKENLNALMDMVDNYDINEELLQKEKGIIISEYNLYIDTLSFKTQIEENKILFHNEVLKNTIELGTPDNINSITVKELKDIYNMFYAPNNMYLLITGNVDQKEIIEIVREKQKTNNKRSSAKIIKLMDEKLPIKDGYINLNKGVRETSKNYKLFISDLNLFNVFKFKLFNELIINTENGILESAKKNKLTDTNVDSVVFSVFGFIFSSYFSVLNQNKEKDFINLVEEKINNYKKYISEKDFRLYLRNSYSQSINSFDNQEAIRSLFINFILEDNLFNIETAISSLKELTFNDFIDFIDSIDFSINNTIIEE